MTTRQEYEDAADAALKSATEQAKKIGMSALLAVTLVAALVAAIFGSTAKKEDN